MSTIASAPETITVPRPGMLATVRNRRGLVAAVEPFDGESGRLHLVHLEYNDDRTPSEERILWEVEPDRHLLEPNALPDPARGSGAMPPEDFDALVRAARWTALTPYLDPDGECNSKRRLRGFLSTGSAGACPAGKQRYRKHAEAARQRENPIRDW